MPIKIPVSEKAGLFYNINKHSVVLVNLMYVDI